MRTFVIAEAGVNHNGSEELALALVECAARAGADAVKFQTFHADDLVTPEARKADYQTRATGEGNQHEMLRALELSGDMHQTLFERCRALGIEFMSTPFDEAAADFLVNLGVKRLKVPSGELTNIPFLEHLAGKGIPLIVSTGMGTLDEVRRAVETIEATRLRCGFALPLSQCLTLLHCTSNYPAALSDVNLRAMVTIARETNLPVGYSDHTLGATASTAAVALGAVVIEKHFTLDRTLPGPDHGASLLPDELQRMIEQIREVEAVLGSPIKAPAAAELPIRDLVRRSVTARRRVPRGTVLSAEDLALLRPGTGIPPAEYPRVLGRLAARDLEPGTTLEWSDLQ